MFDVILTFDQLFIGAHVGDAADFGDAADNGTRSTPTSAIPKRALKNFFMIKITNSKAASS